MSTIALTLNPTHFKTHVRTASLMFTESSHMARIAMMAEVDCSRHELSLEFVEERTYTYSDTNDDAKLQQTLPQTTDIAIAITLFNSSTIHKNE